MKQTALVIDFERSLFESGMGAHWKLIPVQIRSDAQRQRTVPIFFQLGDKDERTL